jgi:hypothetical protein
VVARRDRVEDSHYKYKIAAPQGVESNPATQATGLSGFKQKAVLRRRKSISAIYICSPPPDDEDQFAEIYESPDSDKVIGHVHKGEKVEAAGEPTDHGGHDMLPIKPKGAVELDLFTRTS